MGGSTPLLCPLGVWAAEGFGNDHPKFDLSESRRIDFLDAAKGSRTPEITTLCGIDLLPPRLLAGRLCPLPRRRRDAGRHCLRDSIVPDGRCHRRCLRGLWRHPLDAGCVLRRRRRGDRHHRDQRLQADDGEDKLLWAIFLASAAVPVITKSEIVWLFLGAGVLVWLVRAPPKRFFGTGLNY